MVYFLCLRLTLLRMHTPRSRCRRQCRQGAKRLRMCAQVLLPLWLHPSCCHKSNKCFLCVARKFFATGSFSHFSLSFYFYLLFMLRAPPINMRICMFVYVCLVSYFHTLLCFVLFYFLCCFLFTATLLPHSHSIRNPLSIVLFLRLITK